MVTGSSLTKCTFNGLQCCSQFTITLFERGLNLGINDYAPNFFSGFDAAQKVIDELRSIHNIQELFLSLCKNLCMAARSMYITLYVIIVIWCTYSYVTPSAIMTLRALR